MIALSLFSLAVIAVRIWRRMFSRAELALLIVVVVNYAVIIGQSLFEGGSFHMNFPESRYTIQSTLLLYPWGVHGIFALFKSPKWSGRCLAVVMSAFALLAAVMMIKSKIPGSRRNAHVLACNWAVEKIRADWDGPLVDTNYVFCLEEYHRPNRPVVHAHTARLPYLLNGRLSSLDVVGDADTPDYWFDDVDREDPPTSGYRKIDAFECGKYRFGLYRRTEGGER